MDKELIAKRFAKAAKSYEHEAIVQRAIVRHQMMLLQRHWFPPQHPFIFEIGCGTGFLTRELRTYNPKRYIANDLINTLHSDIPTVDYPNSSAKQVIEFYRGDAEQVTFPSEINLIASCSAIQWLNNLPEFIKMCHGSLCRNGLLALTSFGTKNFCEIRQLTNEGLVYYPIDKLTHLIGQSFKIIHAEEDIHTLNLNSAMDVLRHLRATGVNGIHTHQWSKESLHSFCQQYQQQFANGKGGVTLTYHPLYILAQKI